MANDVFTGTVASVVYENESFYILKVLIDGTKNSTIVKGDFPAQEIKIGAWISFEGVWKQDQQYGNQLTAVLSPAPIPSWTDERVLSALSSTEVGPTSRACLHVWARSRGLLIQEVLDAGDLEGLTLEDETKEQILTQWRRLRTFWDAANFMTSAGIPSKVLSKVWAVLGDEFAKVVTEDPWVLVHMGGISFKEADEVAQKLQVPLGNPGRIRGAVLSASKENLLEGNVFTTTGQIVSRVSNMIPKPQPTPGEIAKAITSLQALGVLVIDKEVCPGVVAVYDKTNHKIEKECAELLVARHLKGIEDAHLREALAKVGDAVRDSLEQGTSTKGLAEEALRVWATGKKISLTAQQQEAAVKALVSPVSILTGLPGTGKTTTLMAVVSVLQDMGVPLLLCAPTGIAAKRMSIVTGKDAYTIHRAFGAKGVGGDSDELEATYVGIVRDPGKKHSRTEAEPGGDWDYGPNRHHPAGVTIIDECSMLDLHMLHRVMTSTSTSCRIVFVGDPYQLPSVGSGDVLRDLVQSGVFPHSHLDQIFRQEGTSGIVLAAHEVHAGRTPKVDGKDFILFEASSELAAADLLVKVSEKLYDKESNFQVLSPRHAGDAGVTTLNQRIRIVLNPALSEKNEQRFGDSLVREGDRIMVVKNDANSGVYNGDVGKISRIDKKAKEVEIKVFEGVGVPPRLVRYPFKDAAKSLRLAYAQTVHKSQGQEYDIIVIPVLSSFGRQLQRNLFYTAITRAKKKVIMIGSISAIERAVQNNASDQRNSFLSHRIKAILSEKQQ